MKFMVDLDIKPSLQKISYGQKIMLVGSCFTEHIGNRLADLRFDMLMNPNGIIFDPHSVASGLAAYTKHNYYRDIPLYFQNDLWHSWQHHSRFSGMDKDAVFAGIQQSHQEAHDFLQQADWLIITLGTAFSYRLVENNSGVANCHRAPSQMFRKHLMTIEEINSELDNCLHQLFFFNPNLRVIFTVSPVRHIRDGLVENNRSKSRLIESVHHLVNKFDRMHYFPSYELVIDVLRDYRFYDQDLVHPNYQATGYVIDHFLKAYLSPGSLKTAAEIGELVQAGRHRVLHPGTDAHKAFLKANLQKIKDIKKQMPAINLHQEEKYFSEQLALFSN